MTTSKAGGGKSGSFILAHCDACGKEYKKTREWQHFCSTKCRRDSWKADKLNVRRLMDHESRLRVIEEKLAHLGLPIHPPFKSVTASGHGKALDGSVAVGSPRNAHAQDAGEGVRVNSSKGA